MNNETDFKKVFCNSVDDQGGYTFKIAASSMSGLPDLYCAMPGFVPLLLEAKWIKNISGGKFKRKIPYRPLQQHVLNNCNKVYKYRDYKVAYCLLGIDLGDYKCCTLIDPEIQVITNDLFIDEEELILIKDGNFIDVERLFSTSNVTTCTYNPDHENVIRQKQGV